MRIPSPIIRSAWAPPLVVALAAACSTPSPVDEIVASNLAARGGMERIQALQSIRETATVTASGGRIAQVVREIKRPGLYRLEFSYQGTTSVYAIDGATSWQVAPLQGSFEPEIVEADLEAAAGIDRTDLEGPLVGWREKGHTVELVGRETLPGGEAFKLRVALAGGGVRHDWVDVASRHIVRSEVTRTIRGRQALLENTFSDFRETGGLVFPHRIETRVAERPEVLTITIDSVELDPDLDDERFRFPG